MSATAWGKKKVTREDVRKYVDQFDYFENWCKRKKSAFADQTPEDFAYTHGWEAVLDICRRIFQ